MSDSLQPPELKHTRLPCPSPTPGGYPNPCPSSRWCHPTISSSVIPFSSRLQSFPASRSFPMSQFFASGSLAIKLKRAWYSEEKKVSRGYFTPMVSFPSIPNAVLKCKGNWSSFPRQTHIHLSCFLTWFSPTHKKCFPSHPSFLYCPSWNFLLFYNPRPHAPNFSLYRPNLCYNVMVLIFYN